jgi:UDP-N-acetylglucosamine acyltransferase
MPTTIHPTAIVSPDAQLGEDVTVGPHAMIDGGVQVGDNCMIDALVRICEHTTLGSGNHVHQGAVLGDLPQDARFAGEVSYLTVGDNNQIREYVTFHRASGEGETTEVGSDGLFMAYSHIGHNARVGSGILMANYSGVSGHCVIEDYANISGFVGIHQYLTVGTMAMIGGMSRVVTDVPPYCMAQGIPSKLYGLNTIGLRRRGVSEASRRALKQAYRILYRSSDTFEEAEARVHAEVEVTPEVEHLLAFQAAVARGHAGRQLDPRGQGP